MFNMDHKGELSMDETRFAQVYNYIVVDRINNLPMKAYNVERSKKRKALFAPKVEIIILEPGNYEIVAHGKTYQREPASITMELEAGKYYCLGAAEDGLYLEERPFAWTQQ